MFKVRKRMHSSPFQLVVSDLDGTLLDSANRVSPGTVEAVRLIRERGIRFSIATGRGFFISLPLVRRLGIDQPVIISGGALIAHPDGSIVDQRPMRMEDVAQLVALGRKAGLGISFHETNGVIAEAADSIWEQSIRRNWLPEETERILAFRRVPDLLAACQCPPVRVDMFGPTERVDAAQKMLDGKLSEVHLLRVFAHLEITHQGVNKGSALTHLAEYLNIPLSAVMVIGDDVNDLSMFKTAGFAVAAGNASPQIKALAGAVAPTSDEGAVAWTLKKFVLADG